jgi:hypothetical protein
LAINKANKARRNYFLAVFDVELVFFSVPEEGLSDFGLEEEVFLSVAGFDEDFEEGFLSASVLGLEEDGFLSPEEGFLSVCVEEVLFEAVPV